MGGFFVPIILRLYELTFRLKMTEDTASALCDGQQELRKALRSGSPAEIVAALNRQTDVMKRQADAADDSSESSREIANNTENIFNAVECWGELQSLIMANRAGLLNEAGKKRLHELLGF